MCMLIENLGKSGKSPEKEVTIMCLPSLFFPHLFFLSVLMLLLITVDL